VFLSTFAVVIPFIFLNDVAQALRVSNAFAFAILFLTGFACGQCVGRSPWLVGLSFFHFPATVAWIGKFLTGLNISSGP
jgi:VIT1/CCC1 family predicted Fe2+/Mn2+ transporter